MENIFKLIDRMKAYGLKAEISSSYVMYKIPECNGWMFYEHYYGNYKRIIRCANTVVKNAANEIFFKGYVDINEDQIDFYYNRLLTEYKKLKKEIRTQLIEKL